MQLEGPETAGGRVKWAVDICSATQSRAQDGTENWLQAKVRLRDRRGNQRVWSRAFML